MRQEMAAAGFTEALNFALVRKTLFTAANQHELSMHTSVIFLLLHHVVLPHTVLE